MFGLIKGCQLDCGERQVWIAHLCGLCHTLGQYHGQWSRMATNGDAVLLSVLCEAQSPDLFQTVFHRCPLLRFRRVKIVKPGNIASQYAAFTSMLIGSSKISDHIEDRDTWIRHFPNFFSRIAAHWTHMSHKASKIFGFDEKIVRNHMQEQLLLEQQSHHDALFYSRAIEAVSGEICSHTAVIAGCPENRKPLYEIGRMFGRIIFLIDNYQDYAQDTAQHKFNALAQCYPEYDIRARAQELFYDACGKLNTCLTQLTLFHPGPVSRLFHQLEHIGTLTFASPLKSLKKKLSKKLDWCDGCNCCDCDCDACDCDCDCCDCDCG